MQAMLRYYRRQHIICDDVEDDMKEAHAQCEEDHGVCSGNMLLDNKEVLMDIYKIRWVFISFCCIPVFNNGRCTLLMVCMSTICNLNDSK